MESLESLCLQVFLLVSHAEASTIDLHQFIISAALEVIACLHSHSNYSWAIGIREQVGASFFKKEMPALNGPLPIVFFIAK